MKFYAPRFSKTWPWPTTTSMRRHSRHRPGYFRDYMRDYRVRHPDYEKLRHARREETSQ